ncbi:MAG: tyrosine-protein phosphatase [Bacteroidales bacterium]|nr:tyrosine-protein phosphatase [Bacteroidales bacterium]
MALLDEQFLPVKGIPNARDLGGYKTADGMIVKSGMLIRGASLAMAKDADLQLLANLQVIKVIDFRTDFEKNGKENRPLPEGEILWRQGGRTGCGESFHWCQHGKFYPRP